MSELGDRLEQLCAEGRRAVMLVAPFVKLKTLERLIHQVPAAVPVRCVTRWRPDELAAGVCDVEIWPLVRERPGAELWLRNDLHAKYYRSDDRCLVGSANLTGAALGWSLQPNLELLVELPASVPVCIAFERELLSAAVQADDDLYRQVAAAAEALRPEGFPLYFGEGSRATWGPPNDQLSMPLYQWLPRLRYPEDLYLAYAGRGEELSLASREVAYSDLLALGLSPGLSQPAFGQSVGALLLQMPIIHSIDQFLTEPQRFGAVRDRLAALPCALNSDFDPARAWQTLMRWLLYFLPGRYTRLPSRHSEVVARRA